MEYKAGPAVLDIVREVGLKPERVGVFAAPAGGPKWFVTVGFDKALIRSGFLGRGSGRVLLAGSSAGAWRCLAMACKDPLSAYENLRITYSRNLFTTRDTPLTVAAALRKNVSDFIGDEDVPYILGHPAYDLAVHTVRGKWLAASERPARQGSALFVAAFMNAISSVGMKIFFERVVFFCAREDPVFLRSFSGAAVRLTEENLRMAALATGSLPYLVSGVQNIPGAPPGVYRDGGLLDYQLNQDYDPPEGRITLFFHYQERIVPGWFDKLLKWRRAPEGSLRTVLQVYPGPDFVKMLPGRRLPNRKDFTIFVNRPSERIRRWDEVSRLSEVLGEEFMDAVESNRIRKLVRPL
ncbi:MAG: hypothetical protein WBG50_05760 [Desulfomonilaceae bacterium]